MTPLGPEGPDPDRVRLRGIVATVDREIARLRAARNAQENEAAVGGLMVSWTELVARLALGSAPEIRACPVCHHLGMRAATICGTCWTRLSPLPSAGPM